MRAVGTLKLFDIVLMNAVAVISLRWIASAGAAGPSSLTLWALAALLFFVPEGLAVADLSSKYPGEGGLYKWTGRALGPQHGFLCGWCYWVNNLLYFPGLLLYVSANVAMAIPGHGLDHNKGFAVAVTLGALWFVAAMSIFGMWIGKWIQNLGSIANWIPAIAVAVLGLVSYRLYGSANPINLQTIVPKLTSLEQLSFFAQLCFALAGLELVSFLGGEVENPKRTLTVGTFVAAVLILVVYWTGTLGLLVSVPQDKITIVNGLLLPLQEVGARLGYGWIAPIGAALIALGGIGTTMAWFAGAARVPYLVGVDRYLPKSFGTLHPRFQTPYVAIIVQTCCATLLTFFATAGAETGLESAYKILVDMCLILYFIPYCYLFLSLWRLDGNRLVAATGFFTTLLAIGTTLIPGESALDPTALGKTVGGTFVMIAIGVGLYYRGSRKRNMGENYGADVTGEVLR